jgi:hypothetical protein
MYSNVVKVFVAKVTQNLPKQYCMNFSDSAVCCENCSSVRTIRPQNDSQKPENSFGASFYVYFYFNFYLEM